MKGALKMNMNDYINDDLAEQVNTYIDGLDPIPDSDQKVKVIVGLHFTERSITIRTLILSNSSSPKGQMLMHKTRTVLLHSIGRN